MPVTPQAVFDDDVDYLEILLDHAVAAQEEERESRRGTALEGGGVPVSAGRSEEGRGQKNRVRDDINDSLVHLGNRVRGSVFPNRKPSSNIQHQEHMTRSMWNYVSKSGLKAGAGYGSEQRGRWGAASL